MRIIEIIDEMRRLNTIADQYGKRDDPWIGSIDEHGNDAESYGESLLAKLHKSEEDFDDYVMEVVKRRMK